MGMIAFTIILGDSSKVIAAVVGPDHGPVVDFLISRNFITTVLTLGISYPLSLYRDIEKLSHASALALVRYASSLPFLNFQRMLTLSSSYSMVVIIFTVAIRGPGVDDSLRGDSAARWTMLEPGVFEAIGVISFAFVVRTRFSPSVPLLSSLPPLLK
jgi:sodium-coupled neutral amino acid transporter 11